MNFLNESDVESIQEEALIGLWLYDVEADKFKASPVVYAIHEEPYAADVGMDYVIGQYPPPYQNILKNALDELIRNGKYFDLELIMRTTSGNNKWIRKIAKPIIRNSKVVAVIGYFQDITKNNLLDIEIERYRSRLDFTLSSFKIGVWEWNTFTNELKWDDTMYEIYEVPKDPTLNPLSIYESRIFPEDRLRLSQAAAACIETKKDLSTSFRIKTYSGKIKHIAVKGRIEQLRDDDVWFTGINWDITQDIETKMLIKSHEAKVAAASRLSSLGEMAGGVAHEINNPLAIIQGKAESLKRKIATGNTNVESFVGDLTKIEETCQRVVRIIKGLRAFSRDAENDPLVPISLKSILHDILNLTTERCRFNGIELRIEDPQEAYVMGRTAQLGQVLINLMNNSFDAVVGLKEKWISVKLTELRNIVQLQVMDSGNGIPDNVQEKMMQPFFTTKELGKGTGLGLSIVRGIIEDHHGKFWYEKKARHTCFMIEFPRAEVPL